MKAIVLLIFLVEINLYCIGYEELKLKAINSSYTLKSKKLSALLTKKRAKFLEKVSNPTVEIEKSRFAVSQPIRFFGIGNDLELLNSASIEESEVQFILTKALFIKNLELLYTNYVYETRLFSLIEEELELSRRVEEITKQRLKNGVGTKSKVLMASLESGDIKNRLITQKNRVLENFIEILAFCSLEDIDKLDANFIYSFESLQDEKSFKDLNPILLLMQKERDKIDQKIVYANHSIKSFELFGEFEDEEEGDNTRVGIALQVPLFKRDSQEAEIVKIELKQLELRQKSREIEFKFRIKYLKESIQILKNQYQSLQNQLKRQRQLLTLFEDGYKISKGSLLELIDAKNRLIRQKRELLLVEKEVNIKQIELNFLEGRYNE